MSQGTSYMSFRRVKYVVENELPGLENQTELNLSKGTIYNVMRISNMRRRQQFTTL